MIFNKEIKAIKKILNDPINQFPSNNSFISWYKNKKENVQYNFDWKKRK